LQEGLYTEMFGEQALTQQQKVGAALVTMSKGNAASSNVKQPVKPSSVAADRSLKQPVQLPV
jgi:hypothetical protein